MAEKVLNIETGSSGSQVGRDKYSHKTVNRAGGAMLLPVLDRQLLIILLLGAVVVMQFFLLTLYNQSLSDTSNFSPEKARYFEHLTDEGTAAVNSHIDNAVAVQNLYLRDSCQ